jgi:hypothetical protein
MEGIFEIVFLLLALLGWILKETQDQKRRKQSRPAPPAPRPRPRSPWEFPEPPEDEEAPGGQEPAPPSPTRLPPFPPPAPVPPPSTPVPEPSPGPMPGPREVEILEVGRLAGRNVGQPGAGRSGIGKPSEPMHDVHSPPLDLEIRQRRARMLRRLAGGRPGMPAMAEAARMGILWHEILGPCRAVRGLHHPPTLERLRR